MTTFGVGLVSGLALGIVLGVLYGTFIGIEPRSSPVDSALPQATDQVESPSKTSAPDSKAQPDRAWELPVVALVTALGLTLMPALAAWLQSKPNGP